MRSACPARCTSTSITRGSIRISSSPRVSRFLDGTAVQSPTLNSLRMTFLYTFQCGTIASRILKMVTALLVAFVVGATNVQTPASLGGTAWQLVKFQGGDDKTLTPDDKSK